MQTIVFLHIIERGIKSTVHKIKSSTLLLGPVETCVQWLIPIYFLLQQYNLTLKYLGKKSTFDFSMAVRKENLNYCISYVTQLMAQLATLAKKYLTESFVKSFTPFLFLWGCKYDDKKRSISLCLSSKWKRQSREHVFKQMCVDVWELKQRKVGVLPESCIICTQKLAFFFFCLYMLNFDKSQS